MTGVSPKAANGVSPGLTPVIAGTFRPTAPENSQTPSQTGKDLWSHNILTGNQATNLIWGMAASPLIVDDKVIVLPGGSARKSVVAYDKVSGKVVWTSQSDKAGYSSPTTATIESIPASP